jgi:hypothetical protein
MRLPLRSNVAAASIDAIDPALIAVDAPDSIATALLDRMVVDSILKRDKVGACRTAPVGVTLSTD